MSLLSQDTQMMREVMLAHADAAAAVPVHRDEGTQNPIDIAKYPKGKSVNGRVI